MVTPQRGEHPSRPRARTVHRPLGQIMHQSQCVPRDGGQTRPRPRGSDPHGSRRQRCGTSRGGTRARETQGRQRWSPSDGQVSGLGTSHPGDKVRKHRSPETSVTDSRLRKRESSGREEGPGTPGGRCQPAGNQPLWLQVHPGGRGDLNRTAVRGRPSFPHPRPTSSAALATPSLVSKQSGLFTQVPCARSGQGCLLVRKRRTGRAHPARGPWQTSQHLACGPRPSPAPTGTVCPLSADPTSQETNPDRGPPRGQPGKSWVEGQVREDTRGVLDSQI